MTWVPCQPVSAWSTVWSFLRRRSGEHSRWVLLSLPLSLPPWGIQGLDTKPYLVNTHTLSLSLSPSPSIAYTSVRTLEKPGHGQDSSDSRFRRLEMLPISKMLRVAGMWRVSHPRDELPKNERAQGPRVTPEWGLE